jgi:hypothetical protein
VWVKGNIGKKNVAFWVGKRGVGKEEKMEGGLVKGKTDYSPFFT